MGRNRDDMTGVPCGMTLIYVLWPPSPLAENARKSQYLCLFNCSNSRTLACLNFSFSSRFTRKIYQVRSWRMGCSLDIWRRWKELEKRSCGKQTSFSTIPPVTLAFKFQLQGSFTDLWSYKCYPENVCLLEEQVDRMVLATRLHLHSGNILIVVWKPVCYK